MTPNKNHAERSPKRNANGKKATSGSDERSQRSAKLVRACGNRDLPPKHQAFVNYYLQYGEGKRAATLAGYAEKWSDHRASMLLINPKVRAAIEAGRRVLQARHEITIDNMVAQFDSDREFAFATNNATAAVRASELKAKLAGLLIERKDVRAVGGFQVVIQGLTDDANSGPIEEIDGSGAE